jgi:hypothetical protein
MNLGFVEAGAWSHAERELARRFGLTMFPANDRLTQLLNQEVEQSDFSPDDILGAFQNDHEHLIEFCARWYADCNEHDYGEEWDRDEGDQQAGNPPAKTLGICQGFMIGYTLFFLYAKRNPKALLGFVKRRRIPHAKKVATDIIRVYAEATKMDA